MKTTNLLRFAIAAALVGGAILVSAVPVAAVTTGPNVIAVHRNGAIDVTGGEVGGTVAKMTVPAGNWSITATATVLAIDVVTFVDCQLMAGGDNYETDVSPTAQGPGSSQSIELLLAHHFATSGAVSLVCTTDGWTGDALIRDVHVVAVQVGQLLSGDVTYGTGTPQAYFSQSGASRWYGDTASHDVQDMPLPAGKWLVKADVWGISAGGGQVQCSLTSGSYQYDQSFTEYTPHSYRSNSMEAVLTIGLSDRAYIYCQNSNAGWYIFGSAISAIQVGTLKYGQFGGSSTTTGSGTPSVVGGYGGPGGIAVTTSLASIGSMSLGAGSWFVTSKLSVAAAATPKVTCQLKVSTSISQAREILDTSANSYNSMEMSVTKKLTASSNANVLCNQSAGSLGAFYYYLKVFAMKAGTLTDTALN